MNPTEVFDPHRLRRVFSSVPSGVVAVAALLDEVPTGIVASSFTPVSLDPALVSFCVARTSTTWPELRLAARLGISVMSAEQARTGRQLAGRRDDRFADVAWRATSDGAVLLRGAAGWIDTSIAQEVRAGDHDIVVLHVHDLDADQAVSPLVFHASRFCRIER